LTDVYGAGTSHTGRLLKDVSNKTDRDLHISSNLILIFTVRSIYNVREAVVVFVQFSSLISIFVRVAAVDEYCDGKKVA